MSECKTVITPEVRVTIDMMGTHFRTEIPAHELTPEWRAKKVAEMDAAIDKSRLECGLPPRRR